MEVTAGTPGWGGLIPTCDDKSHLSKGWSGPVAVQRRDLSSACRRSWGFPVHLQLAVLVAVSSQTPSQPHPRIPDHRKCLGCQPSALQARGIASVALPDPAPWPCPAGAAASPEPGEASVPRDAALLPVYHPAGKCECSGRAVVGLGSKPGGTRGSEKAMGHC